MIDLSVLRSSPERVRASQSARGADPELVDRLLAIDERYRARLNEMEGLRAQQKSISKEIGRIRSSFARRAAQEDPDIDAEMDALPAMQGRATALGQQVEATELEVDTLLAQRDALVLELDNIVEQGVPLGGEEDFVLIEEVGKPRDFAAEGFEPRDHVELGQLLAAIEIERASKVSGSRFYYLTGVGALLELALVNMAMAMAVENGMTPVIPPVIVNPRAMEGTGFLGQAAENVYRLEGKDAYLVGTSEVPLAALHMDEIIDVAQLPIRYAGFSSCFRSEAGSYGKDTRGIIRVHQFDKVEMFSFVDPATAGDEHQRLLQAEKAFLDALEIPYRVIDVASGDLGASAARKYDIEAWIPTQGKYREVTSTSNCTEFQARRLNIRMRDVPEGGGKGLVKPLATLNGTLVAIPRVIVAILENHQQPDGSVVVPAALRPYLQNRELLPPQ